MYICSLNLRWMHNKYPNVNKEEWLTSLSTSIKSKYCLIKKISHYSIDAPGQLLKVSVAYWAPTFQLLCTIKQIVISMLNCYCREHLIFFYAFCGTDITVGAQYATLTLSRTQPVCIHVYILTKPDFKNICWHHVLGYN
jgi:hypothetical protein